MQCPVDNSVLQITERQGVEIDYCPRCRGVWLDRGEIDKIIDRDSSAYTRRPSSAEPHRDDRDDRDASGSSGGHPKKKRKESLLGELFNF